MFTHPELRKLHEQFYRPTAEKLLAVLKPSHPSECTPQTRTMLGDITKACRVYTCFRPRLLSIQVSIPNEKVVLNHVVALDLFWADSKPVLHVVDIQTGFGNAQFVADQTVEAAWRAFIDCWVTLYTGYPDKMRVDQGSKFQSLR